MRVRNYMCVFEMSCKWNNISQLLRMFKSGFVNCILRCSLYWQKATGGNSVMRGRRGGCGNREGSGRCARLGRPVSEPVRFAQLGRLALRGERGELTCTLCPYGASGFANNAHAVGD